MWQEIVKVFFIGQVVCEHAAKAAQEAFASTKCRADDKVQELSVQVTEATSAKGADFVEKIQGQCKDAFINLRQSNTSIEKVCESLERLLAETGEAAIVSSAQD